MMHPRVIRTAYQQYALVKRINKSPIHQQLMIQSQNMNTQKHTINKTRLIKYAAHMLISQLINLSILNKQK